MEINFDLIKLNMKIDDIKKLIENRIDILRKRYNDAIEEGKDFEFRCKILSEFNFLDSILDIIKR